MVFFDKTVGEPHDYCKKSMQTSGKPFLREIRELVFSFLFVSSDAKKTSLRDVHPIGVTVENDCRESETMSEKCRVVPTTQRQTRHDDDFRLGPVSGRV